MAIDSGSGGRRRGRPAEARRGARAAAPRAQTLVNWSLYRIGWVVVLLPALIVLVGAHTPRTLPSAALPETFDGSSALQYTRGLVSTAPDRAPGSAGDARAASYIANQLRLAGMQRVTVDGFRGRDDSGRPLQMQNVIAVEPGTSSEAILLVAHHDASSPGPSADDNGTRRRHADRARAHARRHGGREDGDPRLDGRVARPGRPARGGSRRTSPATIAWAP